MDRFQMAEAGKKSAISVLGEIVKGQLGSKCIRAKDGFKGLEQGNVTNSIGYREYDVNIQGEMSAETKALVERAENRKAIEIARQQNNIENVIGVAETALCGKESPIDEEVDEDFITRLFDIAQNANKREMQFIWGRILAHEVENPGSFSLRTLEVVRNLSYRDSNVLRKILPLIFNGARKKFIVKDDKILKKYGVVYEDVLLLDDCGLINSDGMLVLSYEIKAGSEIYLYNNEYVIFIKNKTESQRNFTLGVYTLKKSAVELLQILNIEVNLDYVKDVIEHIRNVDSELEVSIHRIIKFNDDGTLSYSPMDISNDF